jgi:hypothetical protein
MSWPKGLVAAPTGAINTRLQTMRAAGREDACILPFPYLSHGLVEEMAEEPLPRLAVPSH